MRLLLDECVPRRFAAELAELNVRHVIEMGWIGVKNGQLLKLMSDAGFAGLVTTDANIASQQAIGRSSVFVIVLRGRSNRLADIRSLAPEVTRLLAFVQPGRVYTAGA